MPYLCSTGMVTGQKVSIFFSYFYMWCATARTQKLTQMQGSHEKRRIKVQKQQSLLYLNSLRSYTKQAVVSGANKARRAAGKKGRVQEQSKSQKAHKARDWKSGVGSNLNSKNRRRWFTGKQERLESQSARRTIDYQYEDREDWLGSWEQAVNKTGGKLNSGRK